MDINLPKSIVTVSIFGSYARGDSDAHSDLDILVVVEDGSGTASESQIIEALDPLFEITPSLSFYGVKKIRSMFQQGHLFAWHLLQESSSIGGYPDLVEIAGRPSSYKTAVEDIEGLFNILCNVKINIDRYPNNSAFEMGILYVCARNIAMSASWHLAQRPDFGRYSPYSLSGFDFPISKSEYDRMMQCRMASTRGVAPPLLGAQDVLEARKALLPWGKSLIAALRTTK